jgi:DNA-binding response OmpR family regulator
VKALEAGCDDYIAKPVDIDVLLRRIGEVIGAEPRSETS